MGNSGPVAEEYFDAPCPAEPCNGTGPVISWHHYKCGGLTKVSENGILRCVKCYVRGPLYDWRFKCSQHEFKKGSYEGFSHMVNILTNMATKVNDKAKIKFFYKVLTVVNEWDEKGKFNC